MVKKVLSTADGTLDWADAREGDFVRVNDMRHPVVAHGGTGVRTVCGQYPCMWEKWGGILEREVEEHPNGLVPDAPGTVVILGNDLLAGRFDEGDFPWSSKGHFCSQEYIQEIADKRGFEVLVPEAEAINEGIRVAAGYLAGTGRIYSRDMLHLAFPEAFEEADDE